MKLGNFQGTNLPFNRYSWLTTHNSFAKLHQDSRTGTPILAPRNQQDSVTDQLNVSDPSPPSLSLSLSRFPLASPVTAHLITLGTAVTEPAGTSLDARASTVIRTCRVGIPSRTWPHASVFVSVCR